MIQNQQTDAAPAEETDPTEQTQKSFDYRKGYFPKVSAETEDETVIDRFPGTHASCCLRKDLS